MGSSAPTPPTPPNPITTASAQSTANAATATAQTALNNTNQVTPYGTMNFATTGSQPITNPDGTTTQVPTYTSSQTLSPIEQKLFDQQNALGVHQNQVAGNALNSADATLSHPLTGANLPGLRESVGTGPDLQGYYDAGGKIATGYDNGGAVAGGYGSGGDIATGYQNGGAIQGSVPYGTAATSFAGGGPIQGGVGLQAHTADTFGKTGPVQGSVPVQQAGTTFGQTGQGIEGNLDTNFNAARDATTQAELARLQPTTDRGTAALQSQLANQGIMPGTQAYNDALLQNAHANNDLRLGAIQTGNAEQQALFGESQAAGQFHNAAQAQDYGQQQGRGLFGLNATTANNAAALNAGQFANSAQAQDFGQQQARGLFGMQADAQNNAALLNEGAFANSAQQQGFGQNEAQAQYGATTTAQNNAAALNAGRFANEAQAQGTTQNAAEAAFGNAAQQQANQQGMQAAAFGNAAQLQRTTEASQAAAFGNAAQAQQNAQNESATGFYNTSQNQAQQNWIQGNTFANQAREQALSDQMQMRQAPINEISALLHGGQATSGQYQGYTAGQLGQTPISQDTYASANLAQQGYNTQAQVDAQNNSAMFSAMGGLFGLGGKMMMPSDRRLKRDVEPIGIAATGLPAYAFRYLWEDENTPITIGHMADEVEAVAPHAVYTMPGGFLAVDYAAL